VTPTFEKRKKENPIIAPKKQKTVELGDAFEDTAFNHA
jgi:hypothetical protein